MSHSSCSHETYSLVNNSDMWQRLITAFLFILSFFILVTESLEVLAMLVVGNEKLLSLEPV